MTLSLILLGSETLGQQCKHHAVQVVEETQQVKPKLDRTLVNILGDFVPVKYIGRIVNAFSSGDGVEMWSW
jgi:hypothetical protein